MKTSDEILAGAIEVLERDGWHQGSLYKYPPMPGDPWQEADSNQALEQAARTAPVCAMGALHRATSGEANCYGDHYLVNREAIGRLTRVIGREIPSWNDDEDTTKEDVILAFKRALHDGD